MSIIVTELHCYPVKSCKGIALATATIGEMGILHDRQWMVVDERGMFLAQRQSGALGVGVRTLCLVGTAIEGDELVLTAPDIPMLRVPIAGVAGRAVDVQIWRSQCVAIDQGSNAAAWFTSFLSRERPGRYRLVRMANDGERRTKKGSGRLAFADGYPFLVIAQPSLEDLNRRMPAPLPMNRFRPNIVIDGCGAYDEDHMAHCRIGSVDFLGTTLCVRCPITTTDQDTATLGKEPLRTLATYRRATEGVIFGRNFNHGGPGTIAIGDRVDVFERD